MNRFITGLVDDAFIFVVFRDDESLEHAFLQHLRDETGLRWLRLTILERSMARTFGSNCTTVFT